MASPAKLQLEIGAATSETAIPPSLLTSWLWYLQMEDDLFIMPTLQDTTTADGTTSTGVGLAGKQSNGLQISFGAQGLNIHAADDEMDW